MAAEQIQQIVNAQLAVANGELQESLNQRFNQFRTECEASMSPDVVSLREQLNSVTRDANATYEAQRKSTEEEIQRMNVNINRVDEEVVKNTKKIDESIQAIKDHVEAATRTYLEFQTKTHDRVDAAERALSTAITMSQTSSGSSSGPQNSGTTLDNDKRFATQAILTDEKNISDSRMVDETLNQD